MSNTKRVYASVEKEVADDLKIIAVKKNTTVNDIVKGLILDYIKANNKEKKHTDNA